MNSFGRNFRITIYGESHGKTIGVVVDGVKAGISVSEGDFDADLARRRGGAAGTTGRTEEDKPHVVSGVYKGYATGSPLTITFDNKDTISSDYDNLSSHPRPSHADLTAIKRYGGFNDPNGGGNISGRLTLGIVAAGVIAKKMIPGVSFHTNVVELGGSRNPEEFSGIIQEAAKAGDSVGGIIECRIYGVRAGTGNPFFDSVESVMSHLLFSIPAVKGVEFGAGFEAAKRRGSVNNDLITDEYGTTATNNDGGINGGIANGNPIIVRAAIKPTPSVSIPQNTYNFASGQIEPLVIGGRHDACIAVRAAVAVEAAAAIALADLSAHSFENSVNLGRNRLCSEI